MALASETHHPSADSDVQHDQCQLKPRTNHLNEEHAKKRVTFDKNLISSDTSTQSTAEVAENESSNEEDFELPDHVVYKLYLNRLLSAFADRTWDFATGIFVIKLWPESLFLAGVQGILTAVSLIVISPMIGKWIEKAERLFETKLCLIVQNSCVILGGLFVCFYFAHLENPQTGLMEELAEWAPYAFVFFSLMSAVFGSAYTLLLEKDWVLALAPDEDKLTNLNAMLRRIDLCMLTISSFVCGILMQYSDFGTAVFLCLFNFFSGFAEYFLLRSVYYTGPQLLREEKQFGVQSFKEDVHKLENSILKTEVPPTSSTEELSESIFDINTLKLYKNTFLLPGLSFGLMFLTVLGFDSITVGYLTYEKLEDRTVGFVALLAGLFGIAATLLYPTLVNRFGVLKTGLFGFVLKLIALTLCLLTAFFPDISYKIMDIELDVFCFLAGITLSRAGLWIADLAINQLIQTETNNPPVIGGVQNSINILFELIKFALVMSMPNLSQFWILILFSYVSVASGLTLYSFYMRKLNQKNQKKRD